MALKLLEPLQDTMGIQGSIRVQALAYVEKKEWDKAKEFFDKAMEITEGLDSKYHVGQIKYDIGKMHKAKGSKKDAEKNFKEARKLFEEIGAQRLLDDVVEDLEAL